MTSDVVKGGWTLEEDERLMSAIKKYGTRYLNEFHHADSFSNVTSQVVFNCNGSANPKQ